MGILNHTSSFKHDKLQEFLKVWPLSRVKKMSLEEYTSVGSKKTFCYCLEYETEPLGIIGGTPSNKFGIWNRKNLKDFTSVDFYYNPNYAWCKKYGVNENIAFEKIKELVVSIIKKSISGNFRAIDGIDYHSLAKWKIAYIYSNNRLLPIYKNFAIRNIAKHYDHPNYKRARISDLHTFILLQKPNDKDFFDFSGHCFQLSKQINKRSYYIIGSKYEDEYGNDTVDVFPDMLKKNAISTGFFWNYDFTNSVGKPYNEIYEWIDKNIPDTEPKFNNARKTLGYFLNLKPNDIIAVKSHGRFGNLTIIAYAQVKEVDGKIYSRDDDLGHLIYVDFLETGLNIKTGLSYGKTIHEIIPGEKEGHFEKIFGSYSYLNNSNNEEDIEEDGDDTNEKDTSTYVRKTPAEQVVTQTHNKIQNAFTRYLRAQYPNDRVLKEYKNRIDVRRKNDKDVYYYEIKPYNSAYGCIRAGIGQLLDYSHSFPVKENLHLLIVGVAKASYDDKNFICYLKDKLKLSFDYLYFEMNKE